MIDNPILDHNLESDEIALTTNSLKYLDETAKWAKFLAIVGFVILGIMTISLILIGIYISSIFPNGFLALSQEESRVITQGVLLFYLMTIIISSLPIIYLYRFATQTKMAITMFNSTGLTEGLKNLNRTFKFIGILTIIVLGIYAFVLIIMGIL